MNLPECAYNSLNMRPRNVKCGERTVFVRIKTTEGLLSTPSYIYRCKFELENDSKNGKITSF